MPKSKKEIEKQLYETCLDIYFSNEFLDSMIADLVDAISDAKARKRKSIKLLAKAADQYEKLTGQRPRCMK